MAAPRVPYVQLPDRVGLLTKTLVQSPVVHQILPLYARGGNTTHLLFIGEDWLQVHEVTEGTHLRCVLRKSDFDARIRSACILGDQKQLSEQPEDHIKDEHDQTDNLRQPCVLLLVLDIAELVSINLFDDNETFTAKLMARLPLPVSPDPLSFVGQFLVADPKSRAIALAASDGSLMLLSERTGNNATESQQTKILRLTGVIQQMAFLYPPEQDVDQVILLLVIVSERKVLLQQIEWLHSQTLDNVAIHAPQRILTDGQLPSMIVPLLKSAEFLLVSPTSVTLQTQLLSGHVQQSVISVDFDGASAAANNYGCGWAAWSRTHRSQNGGPEHLYLAREDGLLVALTRQSPPAKEDCTCQQVGHLGSAVDSAFAVFIDLEGFECTAIGGDMSSGNVQRILKSEYESHFTPKLAMIEGLPTWTPMLDVISVSPQVIQEEITRASDGLFVTSGRQPHGRIEELRYGVQARLSAMFPAHDLPISTNMWALFCESTEGLLLLLSNPSNSRLILLSTDQDANLGVAILGDDNDYGYDLSKRTLAAATMGSNRTAQISETTISVFENHKKVAEAPAGEDVADVAVFGDIAVDSHLAALLLRRHDFSLIRLFDMAESSQIKVLEQTRVEAHLTCVRLFRTAHWDFAAAGTSGGKILLYKVDKQLRLSLILEYEVSARVDQGESVEHGAEQTVEDLIVIATNTSRPTILCALRNGTVAVAQLQQESSNISIAGMKRHKLGLAGIRMVPCFTGTWMPAQDLSPSANGAIVTCGPRTVLLTLRSSENRINVSSIWITDVDDPSYQQEAMGAIVQLPFNALLTYSGLAGSYIMLGSTDGLIVDLDDERRMVPRSVVVDGTPNRVIYSSRLSCFVVASISVTTVAKEAAYLDSTASRITRALIEFRGIKGQDWRYTFKMQAGERVYGLMEWAYHNESDGQDRVFIIVATGITKPSIDGEIARTTGRVYFLQPKLRDRRIIDVKLKHSTDYDDPVYALTDYGPHMYVLCTGTSIVLNGFSPTDRKWSEQARCKLSSPAVHLSTIAPLIHVTTAADSLVSLQLIWAKVPTSDGQDPQIQLKLNPLGLSTKQAVGQFHVIVLGRYANRPFGISILSTKYGEVLGNTTHTVPGTKHSVCAAFECRLRRSLTRIIKTSVSPPWKNKRLAFVVADDLIGTSIDGTITGLALINTLLFCRLRFLQALCERSDEICPFRRQTNVSDDEDRQYRLESCLGVNNTECHPAWSSQRTTATHIDGDVLQRLLDRGGSEQLRKMLILESERKDHMGEHVKSVLKRELDYADYSILMLESILDRWF